MIVQKLREINFFSEKAWILFTQLFVSKNYVKSSYLVVSRVVHCIWVIMGNANNEARETWASSKFKQFSVKTISNGNTQYEKFRIFSATQILREITFG